MVTQNTCSHRLIKITQTKKFRLFACALSGIVSSIPYFFPALFAFSWVTHALCFYLIIKYSQGGREACLYLFATELFRNIMTFVWFRELASMAIFDMPMLFLHFIIAVAIFGISLIHSSIICISAAPIRAAFSHGKNACVSILCASLFYTGAEMLVGMGPLGFPWSGLYISQQYFLPAIQSASLFGAYFVTFLIVFTNISLAYIVANKSNIKTVKAVSIFAAAVLAANIVFGTCEMIIEPQSIGTITVAAVQDNSSSYDKWDGGTAGIYDRVLKEVDRITENDADLIVCSETVFPVVMNIDPTKTTGIAREVGTGLVNLSKRHNTAIIAGAFSKKDGYTYNSQFLFDNGVVYPYTYNKRSIVPFGEYLPMKDFLLELFPFLGNMNLSGNSLSPGEKSLVLTSSAGKLGCIICFDSIFYDNARSSTQSGAEILVLSTNDSWYNDSSATVQHIGHAVFRAVENKRYLVRSATTGYSAIITEDGRVTQRSELLTQGHVTGSAKLYDKVTLFTKYGYMSFFIMLCGAIIYLVICFIKDRNNTENN